MHLFGPEHNFNHFVTVYLVLKMFASVEQISETVNYVFKLLSLSFCFFFTKHLIQNAEHTALLFFYITQKNLRLSSFFFFTFSSFNMVAAAQSRV